MIPSVLLSIFKNHARSIILGILLMCTIVLGVRSIYSWGYNECKEDWVLAIAERDALQAKQTDAIVLLSHSISKSSEELVKRGEENLAKIVQSVKNKPLYTIVDGKCTTSTEFQLAYRAAIKEGNK